MPSSASMSSAGPSSSSSTQTNTNTTLSSVVSNLVRASMGTSLSPTVTDEDLDRHVAELILKEAKKKAEKYNQHGIRAYISNNLQDSNAPRPNKRFLTSIIRSTDDHNKAILRAQAQAAEEIKQARREQEKKERRARAEEAVHARRSSERYGHSHSRSWREKKEGEREDDWDWWDGRSANREQDRKKRNNSSWELVAENDDITDREAGNSRTPRSRKERSRSRDRESRRGHNKRKEESKGGDQRVDDKEKRRRRRRSRSASPKCSKDSRDDRHKQRRSYSREQSGRKGSPKQKSSSQVYALDELQSETDVKEDVRSKKSYKSRLGSLNPRHSRNTSLSPGPSPPPNLPSKMDKYFEESYDPRLDVGTMSTTPNVPSTGLIDNAEFEGWDAMLELIRIRREDKEEKKRLEKLGLIDKKDKKSKIGTSTVVPSEPTTSILDIEYKKRGTVREWDLGKEGVDLSF